MGTACLADSVLGKGDSSIALLTTLFSAHFGQSPMERAKGHEAACQGPGSAWEEAACSEGAGEWMPAWTI